MQTRMFFRIAVLLPLLFLLVLWCWEPRLWQLGEDNTAYASGIQMLDFARSWLLMGGAQYMLSAAAVLYAMERMRRCSQIQLLFALCPVIFFAVCCAFAAVGDWLTPMLGKEMVRMEFGGVFLALGTLTLGTLYVFIMSVIFVVLRSRQRVGGANAAWGNVLAD